MSKVDGGHRHRGLQKLLPGRWILRGDIKCNYMEYMGRNLWLRDEQGMSAGLMASRGGRLRSE